MHIYYIYCMHIRQILSLSLLLVMVLFSSCKRSQTTDDAPKLTVSIEPVRYVVEQIAGTHFTTETLMPLGASPETYEPTPGQMMTLDDSEALFRVGTLGFEQSKLPKLLSAIPHLPTFDLGRNVTPLFDHQHQHNGHNSIDPHVWMSPDNLNSMAAEACKALCRIDSLNSQTYRQNLDRFCRNNEQLDDSLRQALKSLRQRTFIIHHPALGYFAQRYGLRQIAVEHDGKEPSAARIKQIIGRARAEGVTTVFISKEHTGRAARQIAEAIGAKVVEINPLDYDVPRQLRLITDALTQTASRR